MKAAYIRVFTNNNPQVTKKHIYKMIVDVYENGQKSTDSKTIQLLLDEKHLQNVDEDIKQEILNNKFTFAQIAKALLKYFNQFDEIYTYGAFDFNLICEEFLRADISFDKLEFYKNFKESFENVWEFYEPRNFESAAKRFGNSDSLYNVFKSAEQVFGDVKTTNDFIILDSAALLKQDVKTKSIYFNYGKHSNSKFTDVYKNDYSYITWIISSEQFPKHTKECVVYLLNQINTINKK